MSWGAVKGISHFVSGVAIALSLPQVVHLSADGSFIVLLAGLGAIMPDTLDFRVARYIMQPDVEIDPGVDGCDLDAVARHIADAIDRAGDTGKPVRVQLHSIRLGVDLWQAYSVRFDRRGEVCVRSGPFVHAMEQTRSGHMPALPESRQMTRFQLGYTFDDEISIGSLDDPMFEFRRRDGIIEIDFLP